MSVPRQTKQSVPDLDTKLAGGDLRPSSATLEIYRTAFRQHGRTEAALLWSKNKQATRFEALCRTIPNVPGAVLDFGCGLGDLAIWLKQYRPALWYLGADAVGAFIESNRVALPQFAFQTIDVPEDIPGTFDFIICSGVFNIDGQGDVRRHWIHIANTLASLMSKTRRSLHVDFLAHDVDFRQPTAHHQDAVELARFVEERLSRRYLIDRTYMPYEFCISIFANADIDRSRNVYAGNVWP